MTNITVTEREGALVVDSRIIAAELGIEHENLIDTVKRYEAEISELGIFRFQTGKPTEKGGRPQQFIYLNEDQAIFVATLSRNTKKVVQFKLHLVKSFSAAKQQLQQGQREIPSTPPPQLPADIPSVTQKILTVLEERPGLTKTQIAEALSDIHNGSISSAIDRLWKAKRITRERKLCPQAKRPLYHYSASGGQLAAAKADAAPAVERYRNSDIGVDPVELFTQLARIEQILAPQVLPPDLAAQLSGGNPYLCWILRRCQISRDGANLTINFPSTDLETFFMRNEYLASLATSADAMGLKHITQQANGELSLQWGVECFFAYDPTYKRLAGRV